MYKPVVGLAKYKRLFAIVVRERLGFWLLLTQLHERVDVIDRLDRFLQTVTVNFFTSICVLSFS